MEAFCSSRSRRSSNILPITMTLAMAKKVRRKDFSHSRKMYLSSSFMCDDG